MKAQMMAKLTKMSANASDKMDSVQFQLNEELMDKFWSQVLELRRYDKVKMVLENPQGQMWEGGVKFFKKDFQSYNTSIAICVTEKGFICTMTLSIEDKTVFDAIVQNSLRDKLVTLQFEAGSNPYTK